MDPNIINMIMTNNLHNLQTHVTAENVAQNDNLFLQVAAKYGSIRCMKYLVSVGADIAAKKYHCIIDVARQGYYGDLKWLIGILPEDKIRTVLQTVAIHRSVGLLKQFMADRPYVPNLFDICFAEVIYRGNNEMIKYIIKYNSKNPNIEVKTHYVVGFITAIYYGNKYIVKKFIKMGVEYEDSQYLNFGLCHHKQLLRLLVRRIPGICKKLRTSIIHYHEHLGVDGTAMDKNYKKILATLMRVFAPTEQDYDGYYDKEIKGSFGLIDTDFYSLMTHEYSDHYMTKCMVRVREARRITPILMLSAPGDIGVVCRD